MFATHAKQKAEYKQVGGQEGLFTNGREKSEPPSGSKRVYLLKRTNIYSGLTNLVRRRNVRYLVTMEIALLRERWTIMINKLETVHFIHNKKSAIYFKEKGKSYSVKVRFLLYLTLLI